MNSCHAVSWVLIASHGPLFPLGHVPMRLFQEDAWRDQLPLQDLTQDSVSSLQDPVLHRVMVAAAKAAPNIHIPASPLLLVSTRSSSTSFLTGLSTTCVRKLSSVLCRSLVHHVCSAVLFLQQRWGCWSRPQEPGSVTVRFLPAVCKRPHPLAAPNLVSCNKHPQQCHPDWSVL